MGPSRWIIDFGARTLEEAALWPAALAVLRERVKPERDRNRRAIRRERWWLLGETVPAMRRALRPLSRYLAANAQGKRIIFTWCEPLWCPSNLVNIFAFEDDMAFGVLSSSAHGAWASRMWSTLEDRPRYTTTSCFDTLPWPGGEMMVRVDEVAARIDRLRREVCTERQIGLTTLYNLVDEGAFTDLRDLHRELDEAVATCYGWPKSVAHDPDEICRRLLGLNHEIATGRRPYDPFGTG